VQPNAVTPLPGMKTREEEEVLSVDINSLTFEEGELIEELTGMSFLELTDKLGGGSVTPEAINDRPG